MVKFDPTPALKQNRDDLGILSNYVSNPSLAQHGFVQIYVVGFESNKKDTNGALFLVLGANFDTRRGNLT